MGEGADQRAAGRDADPPGLDLDRLRAYLDREHPGLIGTGELRGEVIGGGRSNLTYTVTDGRSRWIVRRPPLGHVLPTAHDMSREYRVITALHDTSVPVPRTFLLSTESDVVGAPFYVMEHVAGTPYHDGEQLAAIGPERTRAIGLRLVDTLVELHAVDPASVRLADFGRPEGFLERQLRRWKKQLDASRSRDVPRIDELHERLGAAVPVSPRAAIVHGDYRLDNALVDDEDRISAVLDWEMSTVGDPLSDLALLVMYADPAAVGNASHAAGYPGTEEMVTRYAERSGRDVSGLEWYVALAYFKLAVICEGIHLRFSHGQTVGEGFEHIGTHVGPLVAGGHARLDAAEGR
ncbi:MAG: phosphotransferase [Streptosporangiales bacterium]|nr:phosphotransferase [Streptosporangiales bacterium]